MLSIPQSFAEVTPGWLTAALRSSGHLEEHAVASLELQSIGEEAGFASRVARIHLAIDPPTERLPGTLILKLAAETGDAARAEILRDKYVREAMFYSVVWPHVGACTPACYFVAHQSEPPAIALLLEDLIGARFGDAEAGWTSEDAERVLAALADLHATWATAPGPATAGRYADEGMIGPTPRALCGRPDLRETLFSGRLFDLVMACADRFKVMYTIDYWLFVTSRRTARDYLTIQVVGAPGPQ